MYKQKVCAWSQSEEACVSDKISFTALFDQTFIKNTGVGKSKNTAELMQLYLPQQLFDVCVNWSFVQ